MLKELSKETERLSSLASERWERKSTMARDLKISDSYLWQILKGQTGISATVLKKLANVGIDVNWLLTGKKYQEADFKKSQLEGIWHTLSEEEKEQAVRIIACLKISTRDRLESKNLASSSNHIEATL